MTVSLSLSLDDVPSFPFNFSLQSQAGSPYPTRLFLSSVIGILLILWILGFSLHVAGSLIHLLLVVALIVLVINLVTGRRAAL